MNTDWWNYGGITRPGDARGSAGDVYPRLFHSTPEKGPRAKSKVGCSSTGRSSDKLLGKPAIRIPEAGCSKTFQTDVTGRAELSFSVDLTLWTPENPKLYTVEISLSETDKVADHIGFRSLSVQQGADILLNGNPLFLRCGSASHEESPAPFREGRGAGTMPTHFWAGKGTRMRNFVRLAHYPHNEAMLRMADQIGGLGLGGRVPVYWTIQWENPATLQQREKPAEAKLVARYQNRASSHHLFGCQQDARISEARNRFLEPTYSASAFL